MKPSLPEIIAKNKAEHNGKLCCYICKNPLNEGKRLSYVIEHIDGNRKNNNISNLNIACRGCNYKKNPPRIFKYLKSKDLTLNHIYTYTERQILNDKLQVNTVAMAKHLHSEPKFREFSRQILLQKGVLRLKDLVAAGAEHSGVQMERGYKYAEKMCSLVGDFETYDENGESYIRLKKSVVDAHNKIYKVKYD